jgi:predicted DNA-binding ribbon-helix-helix protein
MLIKAPMKRQGELPLFPEKCFHGLVRLLSSAVTGNSVDSKMRTINVPKRSLVVGGHKTSITVESSFWEGLREIAKHRGTTLAALVTEVDQRRNQANLSSAIRLFVLDYFQKKAMTISGAE